MGSGSKTKRDGTVLRSKQEIANDYDNSNLPEIVKRITKLDYCWRLNYTMFRHSFILAIPFTMTYHIWFNDPAVWKYKLRTVPYLRVIAEYAACIMLINSVNVLWSLMFEEYW